MCVCGLLTCGSSFSAVDGVITPTTSTQVFYISVSVCCIVIFLVAIILAIMHLHSMKRVEMEDRLVSSVRVLSKQTRVIVTCRDTDAHSAAGLRPRICLLKDRQFVFSAQRRRSKTNKNRSSPQRGIMSS